MKKILIIKTGSTYPHIARKMGDFEAWTAREMGLTMEQVQVEDFQDQTARPAFNAYSGVVITGSHAMVTQRHGWSERIAAAIPEIMDAGIPLLGICYGHQLLAHALGGRADFHPKGLEVGTVEIHLSTAGKKDPLFTGLSSPFKAHVTHAQTVVQLPPDAVILAANNFEAHHGFRVGKHTWGIQFHPEFDAAAMKVYIDSQATLLQDQGDDPARLRAAVTETPHAAQVLRHFAALARRI